MQENMITEEKWIDVKGYDGCNRLEYELFPTLGALIKDLKESLTDYSKD